MIGAGQRGRWPVSSSGLPSPMPMSGGRLVASSIYAMRAGDSLVLFTGGAIVAIVTFAAAMVPSIKATVVRQGRRIPR
jgi:hypothetical protein